MPVRWRRFGQSFFDDPFFSQLFGGSPEMRQRVQQWLGSGVIVRADGLIVTNNHVIEGGPRSSWRCPTGANSRPRCCMADPRTDLAVLKIDTKGERLPAVPFDDSDAGPGGRSGAGDRRSVRRRPDRDHGHRLGAGPHPDFAPATISSSSRPTPRSIPAIPAARWSPPTASWPASTPRSIRAAAAISASASPFPPISRAAWWKAWRAAKRACPGQLPGSAPTASP